MKCEIVTPTCMIADIHNATYVQCPGAEGHFGVMSGHASMVATLVDGENITIKTLDGAQQFQVFSAFAEVSDTGVTVFAENAAAV